MSPEPENTITGRPLILLVDDVPKNIQLLGTILSGQGYHIAAATDGDKAIEMCAELLPDLVLLDILMPNPDGLEVCRILKKSDITKEIPVIFITARTEQEDIIRGFEAGGVDYITKPFNTVELLARVKTHIELKASVDAQKKIVGELKKALSSVKVLEGLLPICSHCKKIRDDQGYWKQVDEYVESRTEAVFSHGICPDCLNRLYPKYADRVDGEKKEDS